MVTRSDFEKLYQDCYTLEEWYRRSSPLLIEVQSTLTEMELDELSTWFAVMFQRLSLKQK